MSVGGICFKAFGNFILHHEIPDKQFAVVVDIFMVNLHTIGDQLFIAAQINDLDFFSLSPAPM